MKMITFFILGIMLLAFVSGCSSKVVVQEDSNTMQEQETVPAEVTDSTNDFIDPNEELDVGEVI